MVPNLPKISEIFFYSLFFSKTLDFYSFNTLSKIYILVFSWFEERKMKWESNSTFFFKTNVKKFRKKLTFFLGVQESLQNHWPDFFARVSIIGISQFIAVLLYHSTRFWFSYLKLDTLKF